MRSPTYTSYRGIDVAWVRKVPAHWNVAPLFAMARERYVSNALEEEQNLLSLSYGHIVRKDIDTREGLLPESFATYQIVERGDIVLRLTDLQNDKNSLRSAIVEERGIVTSAYVAVTPTGIRPQYLHYLLRAYDLAKVFYSLGGGLRQAMKFSDLKWLQVLSPPPREQEQIAKFLDRETARIDALIEKKRRLIELLQEKRAAALTKAVTTGLDPSVTTSSTGKASIGVIPSHWKVKRLKHVSPRLMVGVVVNPSSFVAETGKPFLLGSNIKEGRILWEDAAKIDESGNRANAKSILRAGDLVTVRVGAPGVTAVVPDEVEGGNAASVMIIRSHRSFDSQWLCHVMNSRVLRSQIEIVQYGAAQEQFNISHAVDFWIPVPPLDEQRAIASFIDQKFRAIDGLLDRLSRTIRASLEHRSALISAAVTGQIDVREAA